MAYAGYDGFQATAFINNHLEPDHFLKQGLKNPSSGVGGGFLTSPMTGFKGVSVFADPTQQTLSPAFQGQDDVLDEINRFAMSNQASSKGLGLDSLDYGNMRIYGVPADGQQQKNEYQPQFLPYPEHIPTVTLGRGKKNLRDVGPLDAPAGSPDTLPVSPSMALSPSSQPKKRNKKQLQVRTQPPSTPRHRAVTSPMPITPVSAHIGHFDIYGDTKVPFNTPSAPGFTPNPTQLPFSFSELMDLGLGVLDIGPEEAAAKAETDAAMSLDLDAFLAAPSNNLAPATGELDFSLLSSLPTPGLVGSSTLSSPASTWAGISPMLSPAATMANYQDLALDPMLQANSPFLQSPVPHSPYLRSPSQSPYLQSPTHSPYLQSLHSPYIQSPAMSAAGSAPMPQSSFSPGGDFAFLNHDPYAQPGSADTIRVSRQPPKQLNRKRSRLDFEDDNSDVEDEGRSEYGDDSDYTPGGILAVAPDIPIVKKQRTVSAPIATRRLKPGPKPRAASGKAPPAAVSVASPAPTRSVSSSGADNYATSGDEHSESEEPRGGVPKAVIQSLYRLLPGGSKAKGKQYVCLIEGCSRLFPRKSAIESHIQTHLEDKPYVCSDVDWYVVYPGCDCC
jgi:hypothetical protein